MLTNTSPGESVANKRGRRAPFGDQTESHTREIQISYASGPGGAAGKAEGETSFGCCREAGCYTCRDVIRCDDI